MPGVAAKPAPARPHAGHEQWSTALVYASRNGAGSYTIGRPEEGRSAVAAPHKRGRAQDMTAYIIRRLLFMVPTLFGIMLVSFVVVQFAPGGPVERVIAQLSGSDTGATSRI
jgi:hypothetical protein